MNKWIGIVTIFFSGNAMGNGHWLISLVSFVVGVMLVNGSLRQVD